MVVFFVFFHAVSICISLFITSGKIYLQAPPIEETMDRQTAAAAAAPRAQPKPPRITQHLKNAEVVEGVK